MVPLYALIMLVPAFLDFFGLKGMVNIDFGLIVLVVLAWMYVLRWVWQEKIFDSFFGYGQRPERRQR